MKFSFYRNSIFLEKYILKCKRNKLSARKEAFKNLIFFILYVVSSCFLLFYFKGIDFNSKDTLSYLNILVAISPAIFLYFIFNLKINNSFSFFVLISVQVSLLLVNKIKISNTTIPLLWMDLINKDAFLIALNYATKIQISLIFLFAFCALALVFLGRKYVFQANLKNIKTKLFLGSFFLAISAFPYFYDVAYKEQRLQDFAWKYKFMPYISWDMLLNQATNGLYIHLIQTSRRKIPKQYSSTVKLSEKYTRTIRQDVPKKIYFIMCESCWFNDEHFKEVANPLLKLGFKEFRGISPVYGGGTANSSFEILTGLASDSPYTTGIIYQEYFDIIKNNAITLPKLLRDEGYKAVAVHPFFESFWRRSTVFPKFGFNDFISIEKLNYSGNLYFPRDSVAFDYVANTRNPNNKEFYFITTIFSHGAYQGDDYGVADYRSKITTAFKDIYDFSKKIISSEEDALIVVFGDHKPAITGFFYENKIIPKEYFSIIGKNNQGFLIKSNAPKSILGDVPFLIYSKKNEKNVMAVEEANNLPFYCISAIINEIYFGLSIPSFDFNSIECKKKHSREEMSGNFPESLYSDLFFN